MDYEPLPDSGLDRVRLLEGILISAATQGGGPMDNHTYTELRTAFMQDHSLKALVPSFIRTCRDLSTFRSHTQSVDGQWAPRRAYIREALTPLFDHFEGVNRQPVDAVASDVLQKFDAEGISAVWQKALDRRLRTLKGRSRLPERCWKPLASTSWTRAARVMKATISRLCMPRPPRS